MSQTFTSDIVNLNVGGTKFSTSRQTLTCVSDSFFTTMLSGRIPTCRDETGALFIDRDPKLFSIILNFLRTKELDLNGVDIGILRHEAEFYGVTPLVKRLLLCEDLDRYICGDVLFTGLIATPTNPSSATTPTSAISPESIIATSNPNQTQATNPNRLRTETTPNVRPGNVMRLTSSQQARPSQSALASGHTRNSSMDFVVNKKCHSRKSSDENFLQMSSATSSCGSDVSGNSTLNQQQQQQHARNKSLDLKQIKTELGILLSNDNLTNSNGSLFNANTNHVVDVNSMQVNIIVGHQNWIAVAHPHYVTCYKMKDGIGWQLMFQSPYIEEEIDRIAINSKHQAIQTAAGLASTNPLLNATPVVSGSHVFAMGNSTLPAQIHLSTTTTAPAGQSIENSKMCAVVAVAFESNIRLWLVNDETNAYQIGTFSLGTSVDHLFFIGSQLVATRCTGKIGVWNSITHLWQTQDVTPITSFDTAGSFLLLGSQKGSIYYIDMQKFPLRIKDNDLLVTELYKDAQGDAITALSVYLTPKTTNTGNWIEIAYGTSTGQVRVIVQHPETVGHGPQLFQTFSVHRSPIVKVTLSEKYLVSVCAEYNHVRTWTVTRFRGMISTQPGSTPLASFKIVSIDALDSAASYSSGNDIGPYGERDDHQVFVQKVVPYTDQLFVRLASSGKRICTIKSVDYSTITSFCVHECDGPSRLNSRSRRYVFTGHTNGTIQMWDLTTALELKPSEQTWQGGPNPLEFVRLLDQCDFASNSGYSSPCMSTCSCQNGRGSNRTMVMSPANSLATGLFNNLNLNPNILNAMPNQTPVLNNSQVSYGENEKQVKSS